MMRSNKGEVVKIKNRSNVGVFIRGKILKPLFESHSNLNGICMVMTRNHSRCVTPPPDSFLFEGMVSAVFYRHFLTA